MFVPTETHIDQSSLSPSFTGSSPSTQNRVRYPVLKKKKKKTFHCLLQPFALLSAQPAQNAFKELLRKSASKFSRPNYSSHACTSTICLELFLLRFNDEAKRLLLSPHLYLNCQQRLAAPTGVTVLDFQDTTFSWQSSYPTGCNCCLLC